jgi:hypothetical protein
MAKVRAFSLGGLGGVGLTGMDPGCCCGSPPPCTCLTTICVIGCGGGALAGAIVTVGTLAPVTAGATGCADVCLDALGGAGGYQVKVVQSRYVTYSNTRTLACNGTITVNLTPIGTWTAKFAVTGCCGQPLPGATVTVGGDTYTTDSSGIAIIGITDAGTYPWSVGKSRFVTQTGSFTITLCQTTGSSISLTLLPATGFHCALGGSPLPLLADPVPDVLHLTDSVYGTCTMTYSATPSPGWYGTISATVAGQCTCLAEATVISYSATQCLGTFGYQAPVKNFGAVKCPCLPTDPAVSGSTGSVPTQVTTLSPTIPFNMSCATGIQPCTIGTAGAEYLHPGGATITITE